MKTIMNIKKKLPKLLLHILIASGITSAVIIYFIIYEKPFSIPFLIFIFIASTLLSLYWSGYKKRLAKLENYYKDRIGKV